MGKSIYISVVSLIPTFGGCLFIFDLAVISATILFIQPYFHQSDTLLRVTRNDKAVAGATCLLWVVCLTLAYAFRVLIIRIKF